MPSTNPLVRSRTPALVLALTGAAAGLAGPARADEDSQKLRDRKPAVIAPIYRNAAGGVTDGPFTAQNVILKSWIPLSNFPGFAGSSQHTAADCWGYTSPSGREYALIGVAWGTGVVEVTDPANPVILAVVPGAVSLWHDTAVVGNYAYTASEGGLGIQVINLSQVDAGIVTHVGNVSNGGHSSSHTLLQNDASGFLYICGGNVFNGGLGCVNTTNPAAPAFSGPGWTNEYVHEAQITTFTSGPYAGKEIAFLYVTGSGVAIVDVTNKAAPVTLSSTPFPGGVYAHQGWTSPDKKYLYLDDELDGPGSGGGWFTGEVPYSLTRIFDISNLSAPRMVATTTSGIASIDHNQYTQGRYLFQSNYTSGLHVFDLSDPLRPVRVAGIDTRPEDDGASFNGNWGSYPYFASGTVILSDLERGLFVTRLSVLELDFAQTPGALTPGQAAPVSVQIGARDAVINPASVQLFVSVNGGSFTPTAMNAAGQGQFTGSIPAAACGDDVRYYARALADDGRAFTAPLNAPAAFFRATAQSSQTTVFEDNFQTDKGWTVANTTLTAGAWVRATPAANGGQGAALGDADGSGMAFVTGNGANEDVDGGPTRLLSPVIDLASHPDANITYARWLLSIQGATDALTVEVSNNNGAAWTTVETVAPSSGGWRTNTFRVSDFVAPTAQVRLRLSVTDAGNNSMTEAGVDAVAVVSPTCAAPCYADCNESGNLTVADFGCFQGKYVLGDMYADCNASGSLTVADFGCFQGKYVLGCP
ncbi:MAG: choice-of-anchor B family protein [Phycisphaerales bacterium]